MSVRLYKVPPGLGLVQVTGALGAPASQWVRLLPLNVGFIGNPNPSSFAPQFNVIQSGQILKVPGEWPGAQNLPALPATLDDTSKENIKDEVSSDGGGGSGGLLPIGILAAAALALMS